MVGEKRNAPKDAGESSEKQVLKKHVALSVNSKRVRELKRGPVTGSGPVIYWMSRDQRVRDNWALLYACQEAMKHNVPVAVAFNLVTDYLHAGARQFGFMVRGLRAIEPKLASLVSLSSYSKGIPWKTFRN